MNDTEPLKREARIVRRLMNPAGRAVANAVGRALNAVPGLPAGVIRGIRRVASSRDLNPGSALMLALAMRLLLRPGSQAIVRTPSGLLFDAIDQSQLVNNILLLKGRRCGFCWEPQTSRLLAGWIREDDRVVVAGANIGYHVLMMAQRMRAGAGVCYAFEPLERAFRILENNVALNGLSRVVMPMRFALGERDGPAVLGVDGDNSRIVPEGGGAETTEPVEMRSLDSLFAEGTLGPVSGVVADIEGHERDMIRGAVRLLEVSPVRFLVLEIHRDTEEACPGKIGDLLGHVSGLGFDLFAIRDDYRGLQRPSGDVCRVRRIHSPQAPFVLDDRWFNVLAVRGEGRTDLEKHAVLESL